MAGEVKAMGWSITANLGGDRQIVLQCFFADDMSVTEKNRILDEAMTLVDRQKARAELPEVRRELSKHRETLAQYQEDLGRVDVEHEAKLQSLRKQIADLQDEKSNTARRDKAMEPMVADYVAMRGRREATYNDGATAFAREGRPGTYEPRGHVASNLKNMDAGIARAKDVLEAALVDWETQRHRDIETLTAEAERMVAEREVALKGLDISIKRFEAAVAEREARVAELEKLLED